MPAPTANAMLDGKRYRITEKLGLNILGAGVSYYALPPTSKSELKFEISIDQYKFTPKVEGESLVVKDYLEGTVGLSGIMKKVGKDSEISIFDFSVKSLSRPALSDWELEVERPKESAIAKVNWNGQKTWGEAITKMALSLGQSKDLDFLNGFRIGGFASNIMVPGYYRSEFRAKADQHFSLSHQYLFTGGAKLSFSFAQAQYAPIQSKVINSQEIVPRGLAVWLYYPVAALRGMPLQLKYGRGFTSSPSSVSSERQEILLGLVAAF